MWKAVKSYASQSAAKWLLSPFFGGIGAWLTVSVFSNWKKGEMPFLVRVMERIRSSRLAKISLTVFALAVVLEWSGIAIEHVISLAGNLTFAAIAAFLAVTLDTFPVSLLAVVAVLGGVMMWRLRARNKAL